MIKKLYLPVTLATVAALSSCSSKLGPLSADNFTVIPSPLEAVGGQVPATINGKFPEKYMKKKAVVTVTPVLKYNGGQAVGQSATFQGEKVEQNNQTISYLVGGHYTMKSTYVYVPEMAKSDLYLTFDAKVGKKKVQIPEVKIAEGVVATSELVKQTIASSNPSFAEDAFQRVIQQKQEANIKFLIQQANLRGSELKSADIAAFKAKLNEINKDQEGRVLDNIEISAYASPDGSYKLNDRLAKNREQNTRKYLNSELKKNKMSADIDTKYTAEDWDGFQEIVAASNMQDKDLILRVLSMYQDPEQREREIRNISVVYKNLADEVLPQLRRSRMTINYEIVGRSDDEILAQYSDDASKLSVEEMLYAATLVDTDAEKTAIYKKTTELYPSDYRAYNNLAELAFRAGNTDKAESYLKQALAANPSAPEANANLGLVALANGNITAAETYLSKGSGANGLNEALGNLYIAQGQYNRAATSFEGVNTNSAALAQILTGDYAKAQQTLANVKKADAYTAYLGAIVAARQNNETGVVNNLKTAISRDASIAQRAANDIEFAQFAASSAFKAVVND